ncbi:MAG: hypothetical protein HY707_14525 [Ignavibacteriae bacterium]|nr:hypothetical protein [Ignavibacteriota bacterium]
MKHNIVFILMLLVSCALVYPQSVKVPKVDTSPAQVPHSSTPSSPLLPVPPLIEDALPNPDSPEGIEMLREKTRRMLIDIDPKLKSDINTAMFSFLQSIAASDQSQFNSVFLGLNKKAISMADNKRIEIFNSLVSDYNKNKINIAEYNFGTSALNTTSDEVVAIMMDKNGIMTAKFTLKLSSGTWKIIDIDQ